MNDKIFNLILPIKLQGLISLISRNNRLLFFNALHYLYDSKLYDSLSNEETKLWHLSNYKLYLMLIDEKKTKTLTYPDYV